MDSKTMVHLQGNLCFMIDRDLATMYGKETRAINQAAKRNSTVFPQGSRFELRESLREQLLPKTARGGDKKPAYGYTLVGASILHGILKGDASIFEKITNMFRLPNSNEMHLQKLTFESTSSICREMMKFSAEPSDNINTQLRIYLNDIVKYDKAGILGEKYILDALREKSPFPDDLKGHLHEHSPHNATFQPRHLMRKVATLRDDELKITFEALFEYGLFGPSVGIYYGIKAVSDYASTSDEFLRFTKDMAKNFMEYCRGLSNKQMPEALCRRILSTDNANSGTFWLTWTRVLPNETLPEALVNLKRLYSALQKYRESSHAPLLIGYDLFDCIRECLHANTIDTKKLFDSFIAEFRRNPKNESLSKEDLDTFIHNFKNPERWTSLLERLPNGQYRFKCNNRMALFFLSAILNYPDYHDAKGKSESYTKAETRVQCKINRIEWNEFLPLFLNEQGELFKISTLSDSERHSNPKKRWEKFFKELGKGCWLHKLYLPGDI